PFAHPDRMFAIWQSNPRKGDRFIEISYPAFRAWVDRCEAFDQLAGMLSSNVESIMTGQGDPMPVEGRWVTPSFFDILGVRAALGRTLLPEDDRAGAPGVIVLGNALWRERFGADPHALGRMVTDR